jgi:hypothetical protein
MKTTVHFVQSHFWPGITIPLREFYAARKKKVADIIVFKRVGRGLWIRILIISGFRCVLMRFKWTGLCIRDFDENKGSYNQHQSSDDQIRIAINPLFFPPNASADRKEASWNQKKS